MNFFERIISLNTKEKSEIFPPAMYTWWGKEDDDNIIESELSLPEHNFDHLQEKSISPLLAKKQEHSIIDNIPEKIETPISNKPSAIELQALLPVKESNFKQPMDKAIVKQVDRMEPDRVKQRKKIVKKTEGKTQSTNAVIEQSKIRTSLKQEPVSQPADPMAKAKQQVSTKTKVLISENATKKPQTRYLADNLTAQPINYEKSNKPKKLIPSLLDVKTPTAIRPVIKSPLNKSLKNKTVDTNASMKKQAISQPEVVNLNIAINRIVINTRQQIKQRQSDVIAVKTLSLVDYLKRNKQ